MKPDPVINWYLNPYYRKDQGPLAYALFGLARYMPEWIEPNWEGGLPILDLGPGGKTITRTARLDWPDWNADQPECLRGHFEDASVGGIYSANLLEHLEDPRHLLREIARVLAPGCAATLLVPHGLSGMYLQDLDHRRPFNLETISNFYHNRYYDKGHTDHDVRLGANFMFGVKEDNLVVCCQVIKEGTRQ